LYYKTNNKPIKRRRRGRKLFIILALSGLAVWLVLYILKGWLLDVAVHKAQQKLKDQYHLDLTFKNYQLNGWREVTMEGINCQTASHDTLAYFKRVEIHVRLWPLVRGKLRLEKLVAESGIIDIALAKELKGKKRTEEKEPKDSSKLARAQKYLGYVKDMADLIPEDFTASHISFKYHKNMASIDSAIYVQNKIFAKAIISTASQKQNWTATGSFDKGDLETHMKLVSDVTGFYDFAMLKKLARAELGVRSYQLDIDKIADNGDDIYIKGAVNAENVLIYNPRISTDTISVPKGGFDFSLSLTDQKIILDTSSRIHLNGLSAMLSSDYTYKYPSNIHARLELAPVPAQNIIMAMPGGTFDMARTMQLDGEMGYHLDFYLNIDTKDSVKIDASVINQGIKIRDYGKADLRKINGVFTYHPYNSRRPILIDSTSHTYTTLRNIPKKLVDAVVGSEDPNFFGHRGIQVDAIESSMLRNMQSGSFRQGGSTITMQLVKNVFLNHRKTIDRKLEEFFLVWLIENCHITSKNRMLEVYLNIIEWGPDVYGIGEASQFYFNKPPAQLNLNECIFLAKIIPQPLGFMHRFDEKGNLKENFQRKVLNTVDRLSKRGKIDEEEQGSYWPEVQITGPAKKLIKIAPAVDSLRIRDSLIRENDW